jgi:hypothetical protein
MIFFADSKVGRHVRNLLVSGKRPSMFITCTVFIAFAETIMAKRTATRQEVDRAFDTVLASVHATLQDKYAIPSRLVVDLTNPQTGLY